MLMARLRGLAHSSTAPINVLLVMSRLFLLPLELPILQSQAFLVCVHPSTKMCQCVHGCDAI
jgi:hypothetical protein